MKNFNALVIGFGSAGRRHCSILKNLNLFKNIYVLTKQKDCNYKVISNLDNLNDIKLNYIIIACRTSQHYYYLNQLEKKIKNIKILVEKPLFEKFRNFKVKKNKVFTGYNLRFHPVLIYLKKFLSKNNTVFSVDIHCKSYLPEWRKNINYRSSNSAKKKFGGGALLELSHEIDYFQWLFGKIKKVEFAKLHKNSNLKIDCEDSAIIVGSTKNINFFINLDFISKLPQRSLDIYGKNFYIKADLLNYRICIFKKKKLKTIKFLKRKNHTYIEQHKSILNNDYRLLCNYSEGIEIMRLIDLVRKKNIK